MTGSNTSDTAPPQSPILEDRSQYTRSILEQVSRVARIGGWKISFITQDDYWSEMTREIFEVPDGYIPTMESAIEFYKIGENRDKLIQAVTNAIKNGIPYDIELQIITAKGNERWIRGIGTPEFKDGICIDLNKAALDFLESTRDEILGKSVWDLVPPELSDQHRRTHNHY